MRFSNIIALAAGLLGLAQAAPALEPRIPKNMKPTTGEWKMDKAPNSSPQLARAFNWVRKQDNALTGANNLLVAAYYDKSTESVYASTIPRGNWQDLMLGDKKHGLIWRAHYQHIKKARADAEDGAYFWMEVSKNMQPAKDVPILDQIYGNGQKKGPKVAVWGVYGSSKDKVKKEAGTPIASCDGCKQLAKELGVYYEDPQVELAGAAMVVLKTIRRSPTYLYLKAYCLCALVTLFKAAPVSSQLPHLQQRLQRLHARKLKTITLKNWRTVHLPPRDLSLFALAAPVTGVTNVDSSISSIGQRWKRRVFDFAQVRELLRRDEKDVKVYPETSRDATVRRSSCVHPKEKEFTRLRTLRISSKGDDSLHKFLGLGPGEIVDPRDVPLIALGGSGGGYRAMYGFAAFMAASKKLDLWDCLSWTAGVSGSCWALAGYYTIARQDFSRLMRHYLSVAEELTHPLSLHALDIVARSSQGVYFLLGPLVRKAQSGAIGLGIMDLYATLTSTYQLLSREPGAKLSRATFQFSRVWEHAGIDRGLEPMPILTAVRKAPKNAPGVKPHGDSSLSKGQPPGQALVQHATAVSDTMPKNRDGIHVTGRKAAASDSPPEAQAYVPTWSYGRTFVSGRSVASRRLPEQSLSLMLGQCTSAPAGPLTGYISALLATLPQGTTMTRLLLLFNNYVLRPLTRRGFLWGNPIRAGHDPNPFKGFDGARPEEWEAETRHRLMDGGMSNNLPNHILARPDREADIIVAFDASSDIQSSHAERRLHNFAEDCHMSLEDITGELYRPTPKYVAFNQVPTTDATSTAATAAETEAKYLHRYVKVFKGIRQDRGKELYIIYCPLLPNGINPGFDPSTASFSTSYNLVWKPEQVKLLFKTAEANLSEYAIHAIKRVTRHVYEENKKRRSGCLSNPGNRCS
ncbi:phospholipase A2 [Apiospora hydei]|uniref:Lysophospholipase n=1 Tax=Apiospora hydei TaxID=1337664 RepID=A0ABR1X907_9PEZI